MSFLRALIGLALCLGLELGLGRWAPSIHRYVDVMTFPLAWYALKRSQRAAILVGCGGGLLQDAWFQGGLFGVNGFCKTLLGWILGGLGARFELNVLWGRAVAGATLPVVGPLVEIGVRRLFNQVVLSPRPWEMLIRAVVGGLLVPALFVIVEKVLGRDRESRTARRRA